MIISPPKPQTREGLTSLALSDAGGITQFGLHLETLAPGARTGQRHWHSAEDEMLYLLAGEATLLDDDGETPMQPGQAACFRRGDANAHAMANRGDLPCTWVMLGTRALGDICTYEDGSRQVNTATNWQVESAQGARLRGGPLPPHLLNLAEPWGAPSPDAPRVIRPGAPMTSRGYVHPILGGGLGDYDYHLLSDPGGLTQIGAFVEILPPGSRSSFRHWHAEEDEFALVLNGHPTLVEDRETRLSPGDALAWPKGSGPAHCLRNDSDQAVSYLVAGTRLPRDAVHYPDHDLIGHKDGAARRFTHADGRPRGAV
ncbi:cupin domain-containing protein [Stagnihabitans tardus]|uniref:Cupin domain-containing protein n=1 Tax=Stagnihabitans tardus TaxID=2699202 RepID=A0AAE4YEN1_9RHOB|nr:cupin domain-containing protein [Stagnihabitans tardus]NBZ88510.1 cupin domain-containing protein [Stagnihabitans tardus]